MKITCRKGKYYNTWKEGDKVVTQDVKTGRVAKMSRKQAKLVLRDTKDMKAARDYSNGKKG